MSDSRNSDPSRLPAPVRRTRYEAIQADRELADDLCDTGVELILAALYNSGGTLPDADLRRHVLVPAVDWPSHVLTAMELDLVTRSFNPTPTTYSLTPRGRQIAVLLGESAIHELSRAACDDAVAAILNRLLTDEPHDLAGILGTTDIQPQALQDGYNKLLRRGLLKIDADASSCRLTRLGRTVLGA